MLQENIRWAQIEIKPCKSHNISIVEGQITNDRFCIAGEPKPTIIEKTIKSLQTLQTLKTLDKCNNSGKGQSVDSKE